MKQSALRNAALTAIGFFGRFGDTGKPGGYDKKEIRGTHKFRKDDGIDLDTVPTEQPDKPFWEMPKNPSFQTFHNYFRQLRHRVFIFHGGGTYRRTHPKSRGKGLMRAIKREKVRAMKDGGHFRGDNRPVLLRQTA